MQYKKLLTTILAGAAVFWNGMAGAAQPIAVENLVQIISKDSATSRTVSWQDTARRSDYMVEYRRQGTGEIREAYMTGLKAPPVYDADWQAPNTYGAYMQQLTPETTYEYRIRNSDGTSGWMPFTTTPADLDKYKVLVFGDSQSTDYSVWGKTARTAWENNTDAAFFINMGDLTDNGQSYYQWKYWYENADVLTSHIPIAPVLGNHEAYSLSWTYAEPYTYKAFFPVPYGSPRNQSRLAYSFDYGNVHYVSLNTDYEELHTAYPTMMADEAVWLDRDLSAAQKAGKRLVILMHRPPWNSPYDGDLDMNGRYFLPLFDRYQVPLVFTGHEHCYARTVPVRDSKPDSHGTVYITTGRSGTEAWDGSVRRPFDSVYYNPMDMPMYLVLQVEPDDFRVTAYKNDGTIIDAVTVPAKSPQPAARKSKK